MHMDEKEMKRQIEQLQKQLSLDFVGISLVHRGSHQLLTWPFAAGNLSNRYRRIVLTPGKGIAGMVYQSGQSMVIQNVQKEIPKDELTEYPIAIAEKLECLCALPLWRDSAVKGVLMLAFRTPERFTPEILDKISAAVRPEFCGFSTGNHLHTQMLADLNKQVRPEKVPVYELLSYPILKAQEEERRRISRELHDGIVQELLGVQMALRTAKYQEDREDILQVARQADEALGRIQEELRNLSVRLRPVALDDLGLVAALRAHFRWVESSHGVLVHFEEDLQDTRYSQELELVFYRVCQEAVLNAYKYSGCDEVSVALTRQGSRLCLQVEDRGVGFSLEGPATGSGLGLRSMAERTELINGELIIHTAPGKGTRICLTADTNCRKERQWNEDYRSG